MNVRAVVVLAALALMTAAPAYAYVDPGTGGVLVQLVTGGAAGLLVLGRLCWSRLKRSPGSKDETANQPSAPDDRV